ncbi:MAG TPA: hypothetical protein VHM69_09440 [Rubrobacter sp.]|nr:hypothetical protein [Rubrobacter sp.]
MAGMREMIGITAGRSNFKMATSFAYAAGATGILANVFLIAFFALQASHPEVGTSPGSANDLLVSLGTAFMIPDTISTLLWFERVGYALNLATTPAIPIAIGIAILRYRLYDIDILINQTLVYGVPSATLVALYFGGVTLLQSLLGSLTGRESQLAVVASTLVIAALFNPLRRRIQSFIDRRFFRRKYDARKTLEGFSASLRDETDLDSLTDELLSVVRNTMQPAHVSFWLRSPTEGSRQMESRG